MLRILFLFSTFLCFPAFAQKTSTELFEKGLAAYQKKQYPEARDAFQQLIEQKNLSPEVLHNLALTYFQLDQAPWALALWRKALSIDPGFRPARMGRDFVEMKLHARGYEQDRIGELIQRNLEFISFFEALWMVAFLLTLSGWLWIRYGAARKKALSEESPLPAFPLAAILLSVVLLGNLGLVAMKLNFVLKTRATVVAKKTSARSLPSEEGVNLFELNGGSEVLIRRRDKDWLQVQNSDGSSGWLPASELFITSQQ